MSDLGFVIIARNEGERLRRCIESVEGRGPVVYVDSGSTDGSVQWARQRDVHVVELDMGAPFTAARARNAGYRRLTEIAPGFAFAQFVDGDCEVRDAWPNAARRQFAAADRIAIVCGRLIERHPEASIYNRLCQLEWDRPTGQTDRCGGIFMIRRAAFDEAGGFDPSIRAGEEPELCRRLRDAGWKVWRIADEMATHDAAMLRFSQWWTRQVRGAYGTMDLVHRFGLANHGRQTRSAWGWTIGWLLVLIALAVAASITLSPIVAVIAALVALAPAAQVGRIAGRTVAAGRPIGLSITHGLLLMVSKWAQVWGQVRYLRDRRRGAFTRSFEYKAPAEPAARR